MTRTSLIAIVIAILALAISLARIPVSPVSGPSGVDGALAPLKSAFARAPAAWAGRIVSDETMRACSVSANKPAAPVAQAIEARAKASIRYPADGQLMGDWRIGERIAQSGYGLRFTDDAAVNPNGGNCYACHQLTKAEVSHGTLGPSLLAYGKSRGFKAADVKATYDKIYDSHAAVPCSLMPRFGTNGVLTIEQLRHLTALLLRPDSPVNN